jgi:YidC/Oxa1 family membrane protein insertase
MSDFLGVPVDAAYHLVSGLTGAFTPVFGALAATIAIVVSTLAVRLVLMPLSLRAMRGQAAQARLAPQLADLRQRYAKQPEKLQREMSALYRREGTSMVAGFGPLLLQWPFWSVMYLLFRSAQVGGQPNALLSRDLLGVPLGMHALSGAGLLSTQGAVFAGLLVLLAGLCWLSARLARRQAASTAVPAAPGALLRVLPYVTVVIAVFAPLAAGIYLVTSMGWSLAERRFFWPEAVAATDSDHRKTPHGQETLSVQAGRKAPSP